MIRRKEENHTLTPQLPRAEVKFIADAMLGRLARWLRFLGYDTLYYRRIADNDLIKLAREQERIILTRDTRLIQRKAVKDFALIQADDTLEQINEVIARFKLGQFLLLSRCVSCNGLLYGIPDKKEIKDSVPDFVFLKSKNFLRCNSCGKIYWEGSHPKKFREGLKEILK